MPEDQHESYKHAVGGYPSRRSDGGWGSRSYHLGHSDPGWDSIETDLGETLTRREDVEKPLPPFFRSVFKIGPWWFTIGFYAVGIACVLLLLAGCSSRGHGPQPDHHHGDKKGDEHGEIVKLPPEVAKHVKGGWEYGVIGSRKWILGDHGWTELQRGHRDDSKLVVADTEFNSFTVKEYTRGCGRGWTKTDKNGARPGLGVRNTRCNMLYHQTGEETPNGSYDWTIPSYHRDPGRG